MRKSAKIITALSVTGLAVIAGSAFTGAGLTKGGQAASDQFIGGQVSQDVTGAVLNTLTYDFGSDETNTTLTAVNLKFSKEAANKAVTLTLTGTNTPAEPITCTFVSVDALNAAYTCDATGISNVTNASVSVASTNHEELVPSTPAEQNNG